MKQALSAILIVIIAFIAGLSGSLFTASGIVDIAYRKIEDDREILSSLLNEHYRDEYLLTLAIGNIDLIKNNEISEFYKINCILLELQLKNILPETISSPERKERVLQKIQQGRQLLYTLENEGLCKVQIKG